MQKIPLQLNKAGRAADKLVASNKLSPGSIIEYEQHGKPLLGILLTETKGKWSILNERDVQVSLPTDRLYLFPQPKQQVPDDKAARVAALQRIAKDANSKALAFDLESIWQKVSDQKRSGGRDVAVPELVELSLGSNSFENHLVVRRAMLIDEVYFKRKKSTFETRPQEAVDELKLQAAEVRAQRIEREKLKNALLARLSNPNDRTELPVSVELLEQLAALGSKAERAQEHRELIDEIIEQTKLDISGKTDQRAFELLVAARHFHPDENLAFIRTGRTYRFPKEAMQEAERIPQQLLDACSSVADFTNLKTFTLDAETTLDMDDALSIETRPDGYRVGIHITDIASFVTPGSALEAESIRRATSIYTPDGPVGMLPNILSHQHLSLQAGELRPCLSFFVDFDSTFAKCSYKILQSKIQTGAKLSYDAADIVLYDGGNSPASQYADELSLLWNIASQLELDRMEHGATQFPRLDLFPVVDTDGQIRLEDIGQETPSRKLVAEMMVLANSVGAAFAKANRFPLIFRSQEHPEVELTEQGLDIPEGPARDFFQRSFLKRSLVSTKPLVHSGLGLDVYAQLTSPIRRAVDLLNQRQIISFLKSGRATHSESELAGLHEQIDAGLEEAYLIQRERNRYWLLKYLEQKKIRELGAVILKAEGNKPLAEVASLGIVLPFHPRTDRNINRRLGESILLEIDSIDPRKDVFVLKEKIE